MTVNLNEFLKAVLEQNSINTHPLEEEESISTVEKSKQFPISEVPSKLPRKNGKRVHPSTVYRWCLKGVRGSRLESWMIGGVRYTSDLALSKFLGNSNPIVQANRELQIDAAEKFMKAQGF